MSRRSWAGLVGVALVVCAPALRRGEAKPAPTREALRDDARLVLERRCGQCHIGDYPTALPGALAIFNLSSVEWSARMTDAQLEDARFRLGEPLPPDGQPNEVSPQERERFSRFVDYELKRRAGARPPLKGGAP